MLAAARLCEVEVELRRAFNLAYYYVLACGAGLACINAENCENGETPIWGEGGCGLRLSEREVRVGTLGEAQDTAGKTEESGRTSRAGSASASRSVKVVESAAPAP